MFISMNFYWRDWYEGSYSYVESRRCLVKNTGTWELPTDTFSDWPDHFFNFGYLEITSGEVFDTPVPLPDGSELTWLTANLQHAGAYTAN
jgi:hypothetical protein